MNAKGGPIANTAVCVRGDGDDTHLRIESQDGIANRRTLVRIIHRYKQKIRLSFFHATDNLHIIRNFADDGDVGLVRKSLDDNLAHEFRAVGHQDSNLTSHGSLLVGTRIILSTEQWR